MKMVITCEPWQKEMIKKALIESYECPIDEMCKGMECEECLEKRIRWVVIDNGED